MKKVISLCLSILILAAMLAGCASGSVEPEPSAETDVTTTPETVAEAPREEPEETREAETEAPAEAEPVRVSLPIVQEPTTYTLWTAVHPAYVNMIDDMAELLLWDTIAQRTNISFNFTAVNGMAETEQFNLMTAGGDYTDVICHMNNYSSGIDAAIEDEVIIDLSELLPDNCPTYWNLISNDQQALKTLTTETGKMGTIASLYAEGTGGDSNGCILRYDWLDSWGMEVPSSFDELHDYLLKARDEYGAVSELAADANSGMFMSGYNIANFTVVDGQVNYMYLQDEYYDYLQMITQWYSEGLFDPDFYTISDTSVYAKRIANDQLSMSDGSAALISIIYPLVSDPASPIVLGPMAYPTPTGSEQIHVGNPRQLIKENDSWAISTGCQDPMPLLSLVEYMFSDEGILLYNYGVEGVSFEYDENGEPQFNDFIANNDEVPFDAQVYLYTGANIPSRDDPTKSYVGYTDEQWLAVEVFGNQSDGAYAYPSYATMTSDEESQYAEIATDVETLAESAVLQFVIGQEPLTEAAWQDCVESMKALGADTMVSIKQAAYDRAMN